MNQVCVLWGQVFGSCRELCCGGEGVDCRAVGGGGGFEASGGGFGVASSARPVRRMRSWTQVRNFAVSRPPAEPNGSWRLFSVISPHFRPRRHRLTADDYRTTAGPWVRSRSWAAGLEVERDLLRGNVIAHRTGADHSETLTRHRGWLTWTFMWAPAQSSRTASDQDQPASSRAIAALATTGRFLR